MFLTRGYGYPTNVATSSAVDADKMAKAVSNAERGERADKGERKGLHIAPDHRFLPRALRMMTGRSEGEKKTALLLREVGRSRPRRLTSSMR